MISASNFYDFLSEKRKPNPSVHNCENVCHISFEITACVLSGTKHIFVTKCKDGGVGWIAECICWCGRQMGIKIKILIMSNFIALILSRKHKVN